MRNLVNRDEHPEESVGEGVSKEVFSAYNCKTIARGLDHPGDIAEAASLSAIALPQCTYPLWDSLPDDIISSGKLSKLQLEGVLYACNKHQEILPSGERAGFFIGDGAGVGKGRQIAGVILDNYVRGRRKHVWVSTSTDLHLDAERDLRDLGCFINVINNCRTLDREQRALGLAKEYQEGVLFLTYSTLVSTVRGRSRIQQVIDWLGGPSFEGCIVLDECHKAKNFVPGKESQSTKVATCVIELQQKLPRARVLYCSATGVSEVGNMAYMSRMGLWGVGTAFPDFEAFLESMMKRGVSFMEMLAMEMKAEGKYVARGLSFRDAEFMELEAPLTTAQVSMYDQAVHAWHQVRMALETALDLCGITHREVWKPFWSTHQRFFKLLCISLKIPTVVAEARQALAQGQSVVIGLQSTGEAAADAIGLEPGPIPGFVSTTMEMLCRLIDTHFPVTRELPPEEAAAGLAPPPVIPECVELKQSLMNQVQQLHLPPNFLDQLIDELGGVAQVAELTGRKGRVVRDGRGRVHYELRAKPDSTEMDSLNVHEKESFLNGEKLVAIISDAASTGISLHAQLNCKNQRRRVHLTIELPWSADKAIQQLGRSHRSNQSSAPIYKLISSKVGGEKRFAAAVARRLQSLGALTRGDRRAASGIDLSEQNFDSPLGRKALRRMYDYIVQESPLLPTGVALTDLYKDADEALQQELRDLRTKEEAMAHTAVLHREFRDYSDIMGIGLGASRSDTVAEDKVKDNTGGTKDVGDVRRFLNRVLGLPVQRQNLFFNYFASTLAAEVRAAKLEGRYSEGVGDVGGSKISLKGKPEVIWEDPRSGRQTVKNMVAIDRGVSFQDALVRLELDSSANDDSGFRRSRRPMFGTHMVLLAIQKPGSKNFFRICRPNTGDSYFDMERGDLEFKYVRVTPEEARQEWDESFQRSLVECMHGTACAQGPGCQVGKRLAEVTILSGSVVRVWGVLESVLERHQHVLTRTERTMRVLRVDLGPIHDVIHSPGISPVKKGSSAGGQEQHHQQLVGVKYPMGLVPEVVATLASLQSLDVQGALALGLPLRCVATEFPTPVDRKSMTRAFKAPKTMRDFFSTGVDEQLTREGPCDDGEKPREEADRKCQLGSVAKRLKLEPPEVAAQLAGDMEEVIVDEVEWIDDVVAEDQGGTRRNSRSRSPVGSNTDTGRVENIRQLNEYLCTNLPAGTLDGPDTSGRLMLDGEGGDLRQPPVGGILGNEAGDLVIEGIAAASGPHSEGQRHVQDIGGGSLGHVREVKSSVAASWGLGSREGPCSTTGPAACENAAPDVPWGEADARGGATGEAPSEPSTAKAHVPAPLRENRDGDLFRGLVNGKSRPGGRASWSGTKKSDLEFLLGMGFTNKQAERALWATNGNVQRAIDWILSGM